MPFIPLIIKAILITPNIEEFKLCSLEYHEWHFVSRTATLDLEGKLWLVKKTDW